MKTGREGFTLIELLVVIAIIALLMGILMPALSRARDQAKEAICRTNLKSLHMGLELYANDNEGYACTYSSTTVFIKAVDRYVENMNETRSCPKAPVRLRDELSESHLGTATTPWVWGLVDEASGRKEAGSYGVNGWLYPDCPYYEEDSDFPGDAPYFGKIYHVRKPGETPSFGDCATVDSWPHDTNPVPVTKLELSQPLMEHALKTQIKRHCLDRHGMAVNLSYMDGHVSKVRLEQLWLQKWHRDYKPREVSFEWGAL